MNITDNIKALCKLNNVKICDLEKELGRSKGYFKGERVAVQLNIFDLMFPADEAVNDVSA